MCAFLLIEWISIFPIKILIRLSLQNESEKVRFTIHEYQALDSSTCEC